MIDYSKLQNGSDVRGVALPLVAAEPVTLTEEAAGQIARAYAAWLAEHCGKPMAELKVAVGRDSRLSGPSLQRAVLTGLVAMGATAADCGTSIKGHKLDLWFDEYDQACRFGRRNCTVFVLN